MYSSTARLAHQKCEVQLFSFCTHTITTSIQSVLGIWRQFWMPEMVILKFAAKAEVSFSSKIEIFINSTLHHVTEIRTLIYSILICSQICNYYKVILETKSTTRSTRRALSQKRTLSVSSRVWGRTWGRIRGQIWGQAWGRIRDRTSGRIRDRIRGRAWGWTWSWN